MKIFGKTISTPAAVAIGGGSLVAIYFAYKQHKASQAASSSTSASSIDPVTGLPYSEDNQVDPLTGETYLAEAQQYGSVSAAESAAAGSSAMDYSNASNGYGYGYGSGSGSPGSSSGSGTGYSSNAAWAQAVEAGLTDIGYSSTDVAAALGRYLAALSLTSDQATIVQAAIAEYGPPPVGSYQVILAPSTGSTGSGSGSGSGSGGTPQTYPPVPGKGGPITVTPVGLHTTQVNTTSVQVAWTAPTIPSGQGPLTGYTAQVYNQNGSAEGSPWSVPASQLYANAGGLKSKTAYHLNVWCDPAQSGGPHASVTFTTK